MRSNGLRKALRQAVEHRVPGVAIEEVIDPLVLLHRLAIAAPNVLVVGGSMLLGDHAVAVRQLYSIEPSLPIVVISTSTSQDYRRAIETTGAAYVHVDDALDELAGLLRRNVARARRRPASSALRGLHAFSAAERWDP